MSKMDAIIAEMNKKAKETVVQEGLSEYDYKRIPFTSPRMNYCTFGGLPIGKITEFCGEEHGGKTTTALDIIANYQHSDDERKVLYIDAENTLDVKWARKLGVTVEDMIIMQPKSQSAEQLFDFICNSIDTGEIGLWVLDSIGALMSQEELDKPLEEKTYGGIAKPLTKFGKKVEMLMARHKCTGVAINQMREVIGAMFPTQTTPGGKAWKHFCFSGNTKFVTSQGLRRFRDCKDGEIVTVVDKDGELREATVHYFGKKQLQRVKLHTPNMTHEVLCTPDHRWILDDGSVTQNLKVGDKLYYRPENTHPNIETKRQADMFCLGFSIADGCDYKNKQAIGIRAYLYGDKEQYSDIFEFAGYRSAKQENCVAYQKLHISKQKFLDGECWKYLSANDLRYLFYGYMCGDGSGTSCVTHDIRVLDFIKYSCNMCGYFITSIKEYVTDEKSFKSGVLGYKVWFSTHQNKYNGWVVESITPHEVAGTYCVEEPVTHTFTLEKGIVTGNCSVRMQFSRGKFIDENNKELTRGAETPAGNIVMMNMLKNKSCPPTRRVGHYTLNYDFGIDYLSDLIDVAIKYDIVRQTGAWFSIVDIETGEILEDKIHGQVNVYNTLDDNEELLKRVEELVDSKISM